MAKSVQSRRTRRTRGATRAGVMVFSRRNYVLLLIGISLVAVGYLIMRIDNQVDSFVSLWLAPLMILGGYLEVIYAILWRPRNTQPAAS